MYFNDEIKSPSVSPYWEYPKQWQIYLDRCYLKAGFKDKFIPYTKGSGFYRPKNITDDNLIKVIEDHTVSLKDKEIAEDDLCALFGGYVLKIDNQNMLFPQCCSDLGDWLFWQDIVKNRKTKYYTGHSCPIIEFNFNNVIFNCNDEYEKFIPATNKKIVIDIKALEIDMVD